MISLIITFLIAILFIGIIRKRNKKNMNKNSIIIGVYLLVIGLMCSYVESHKTTYTELTNFTIEKKSRFIIVDLQKCTEIQYPYYTIITDTTQIKVITESTNFYEKKRYNLYNTEIRSEIVWSNPPHTEYYKILKFER